MSSPCRHGLMLERIEVAASCTCFCKMVKKRFIFSEQLQLSSRANAKLRSKKAPLRSWHTLELGAYSHLSVTIVEPGAERVLQVKFTTQTKIVLTMLSLLPLLPTSEDSL
jgi:hypothetical protein